MRHAVVAVLVFLAATPLDVRAQIVPRRPAPAQQPLTRRDSLARRDSLNRRGPGRDTTNADSAVVKWTPPDTVMQGLLNAKGYTVTRYEGNTVTFDAKRKALHIQAGGTKKQAAVQRGTQLVVTDTSIVYDEPTKNATIHGLQIVLSDPSSGNADVHATGTVTYNLAERSARITNPSFPIEMGETWYVHALIGKFVAGTLADSTVRGKGDRFYASGGTLTSCSDSIPDYHFEYGELKKTAGNTIVGRPAVLYIRDIPVLWLPFFFQDTRSGRRSGLIPPQFGIADIIRNNPNYRRRIEDLGWYFAINDYMDARVALDWYSNTGRSNSNDFPGFVRYKAEFNYNWLDWFLGGHVASDYTRLRDGSTNLALSWEHRQDFSKDAHLTTSMNYVTNTQVQSRATTNTYTALGTIRSAVNYSQKFGPAQLQLGGTRTQYPGREQVEQTLPSLSITTGTLNLAPWLAWTPSLSYTLNQVLHIDQPFPLTRQFVSNGSGGIRLDTLNANTQNTSITFDTPFKIFGFDFRNGFSVSDQQQNYPQQLPIYDVTTGDVISTRVFTRTYLTNLDWTPNFQMPSLGGHNRYNITPSISFANVVGGPFWVRSQLTNGEFVHQSKRLAFGLSASPTIYGLLPGFGPFSRLRHTIQPSLTYTYAPAASVDTNYLKATNQTIRGTGLLAGLRQQSVTFGLTQNFEAKVRPRGDTTDDTGEKIKLLSLDFQPISYNIEQARVLHSAIRGFTTDSWGYTASSDLLPSFRLSVNYSLFKGFPGSDTAVFSPFRTGVSAQLNLSDRENPFAVLTRLFGRAVPASSPNTEPTSLTRTDRQLTQEISSQPVAGSRMSGQQYLAPPTQGWSAALTFSSNRSRPLTGPNVVQFDPEAQCAPFRNLPLAFEQCVLQQRTNPTATAPINSPFAGGQVIQTPPVTSIGAATTFRLTEKWAASWNTSYDVVRHNWASQQVSLQRDLHDWRAVFGFSQSPNGAFAFTFFIALKAEPDLKFDYNKATYRNGTVINP